MCSRPAPLQRCVNIPESCFITIVQQAHHKSVVSRSNLLGQRLRGSAPFVTGLIKSRMIQHRSPVCHRLSPFARGHNTTGETTYRPNTGTHQKWCNCWLVTGKKTSSSSRRSRFPFGETGALWRGCPTPAWVLYKYQPSVCQDTTALTGFCSDSSLLSN